MADNSIVSTLAPVVVGGLIALAGGWLGPWLLEGRKQGAEKRKKRAEKFEELVATIYEHDHWLENARAVRILGYEKELGARAIPKALAIVVIYFPKFHQQMEELSRAADMYELWIFEAADRRLKEDKDYAQGHVEVIRPYLIARNKLVDELKASALKGL